jgi:hypothetical protein
VAETRRALIWGAGVPFAALSGAALTPWALLILLAWPAQMIRLARGGTGIARAVLLTLGKVPEAIGVGEYWLKRLRGRKSELIEYK